jgi:hypothetical protein
VAVSESEPLRAAVRGVLAAMAMTGMRTVTTGLGLLRETPPEEVAVRGMPGVLARVPVERRPAVVELSHWSYGAFGGAAFGALATSGRPRAWLGPAYGVGIWALFEVAIAPLLGLRTGGERGTAERVALVADHVLYGTLVAGRPRG